MFAFAGFTPLTNGELSFGYIATLLLLDATVLIALIFWLLSRQGERPRDVFMGRLPVGPEFRLGIGLTVVVFALAVAVLSAARVLLPALHNVKENPLQQLIQTPMQALILAVVATISGGLREEIQRAFILHRFEQYLGGGRVGLVLYSLVFGFGHSLQGWDAVLATTILGAFWARSISCGAASSRPSSVTRAPTPPRYSCFSLLQDRDVGAPSQIGDPGTDERLTPLGSEPRPGRLTALPDLFVGRL